MIDIAPDCPSAPKTIGIVGAGQMGQGIAETFLLNEHMVLIHDADDKRLNDANSALNQRLNRAHEKNIMNILMYIGNPWPSWDPRLGL